MTGPAPAKGFLRLGVAGRLGEDRVRLLEAIDRRGSITAAARDMDLSYRATWDAVQGLNNLFRKPLVVAKPGGRAGGMAALTAQGHASLRTLLHLRAEIALTMERLEKRLADDPSADFCLESWNLVMRTSARNALRGTVKMIIQGAVSAEVTLEISPGVEIVAAISRASVEALGLAVGSDALALIKASFVILAAGDAPLRTSARNCLRGKVVAIEHGAVNTEVILELADGKTLAATITRQSAETLDLTMDAAMAALVKASHVILAVE